MILRYHHECQQGGNWFSQTFDSRDSLDVIRICRLCDKQFAPSEAIDFRIQFSEAPDPKSPPANPDW